MSISEIRLWPVPPGAPEVRCRGCAVKIVWGKTDKGRKVPLSISHENAKWEDGICVAAPSHFVDCPEANMFSGKGRRE